MRPVFFIVLLGVLLLSCTIYLEPDRCDTTDPTCPARPGSVCNLDMGECVQEKD